jgi:pseudouridine-5'-phosphate glycosidase
MGLEYIFSQEVSDALKNNRPVVALESTIITYGMPYPQNLETAKALEQIVKNNDCVPATVAIINGQVHIGLSSTQLEQFAKLSKNEVDKVSTRDLPIVLSKKRSGATTVAATSYLASRAGIKFFATGGIGGVHRGVEETLDISNDLVSMSKTQICVVSAGVKSILDIAKTLEMLETLGVPVVTYGSEIFPAFYTRNSGVKSPAWESNIEVIGEMVRTHFDDLDMKRSFFIANPISAEHESAIQEINDATALALKEVEEKNIKGRDITPYVLFRIAGLTENRSLESNIKLIESNTKVASQLAKYYFSHHQ